MPIRNAPRRITRNVGRMPNPIPRSLLRIDIAIAPNTTNAMASHCAQPSDSPRKNTAMMATNMGDVCQTGATLDTCSRVSPQNMSVSPAPQNAPPPNPARAAYSGTPRGGSNANMNSEMMA